MYDRNVNNYQFVSIYYKSYLGSGSGKHWDIVAKTLGTCFSQCLSYEKSSLKDTVRTHRSAKEPGRSYLYSCNQYEFIDKKLYIHLKVAAKRKSTKGAKSRKRHKKRTRRKKCKPFVHHALINALWCVF